MPSLEFSALPLSHPEGYMPIRSSPLLPYENREGEGMAQYASIRQYLTEGK